ncbi:hypothetical protein [Streptomyces sp. NPDC126514]|uniref:hypothetical protein n=1 Tax=Streptomyces sp. NPDC126514 TaxID=3155210 RepID=UPI003317544F
MQPNNQAVGQFQWQLFQQYLQSPQFQLHVQNLKNQFQIQYPQAWGAAWGTQQFQQFMQTQQFQQHVEQQWEQFQRQDPVVQQLFHQFQQQNHLVTPHNPGGRPNNCVFVSCAYLRNTTADQISAITGVPQPPPGQELTDVNTGIVISTCGLPAKRQRQYKDVDTLYAFFNECKWEDGDRGRYLVAYSRGNATGHMVIANVDGNGWQWIDAQTVAGANVADAEGLTPGTSAEVWFVWGPYQ